MKIQIFVRRKNINTVDSTDDKPQSGLLNSSSYINKMLNGIDNFESELCVCDGYEYIDVDISRFKPDIVIIEAIWLEPKYFRILTKMFPNIKWIVRVHSDIPFLAMEGMAFEWLGFYTQFENVFIAPNKSQTFRDFHLFFTQSGLDANRVIYLPNYYPTDHFIGPKYENTNNYQKEEYFNVSCFGSVRPLKNHLVQILAALDFVKFRDQKLCFHINQRTEQGQNVVYNIHSMFCNLINNGHIFHNIGWLPLDQFLTVCSNIDIGLQVSFTETFNFVAADMISQGIAVVGSKEIDWLPSFCQVETVTSSNEISSVMDTVWREYKPAVLDAQRNLSVHSNKTINIWTEALSKLEKRNY